MKGAKHGEYSANFYTSNTTGAKQPSDDRYAPIASLKLQLNGQDRFQERKGSYFSQVQPFSHLNAKPAAGVYMYNFGIAPDQTQPSGTCNFRYVRYLFSRCRPAAATESCRHSLRPPFVPTISFVQPHR